MTHIRHWLIYGFIAAALVCSCDPVPAIPHPVGQGLDHMKPA